MVKAGPKLTAMMLVDNESHRYLQEVLAELSNFVDELVILADSSTGDTQEVCSSFPKVFLYRETNFLAAQDETLARKKLWDLTIHHEPQWILAIDDDEVFEKRMSHEVAGLINQDEFDAVEFRIFDFWGDRQHYRVDGDWDPWVRKERMLFRYNPNQSYSWPKQKINCIRLPLEARASIQVYQSDIRVKHYGWINQQDREREFMRYQGLDDNPRLKSILDPPDQIQLEEWIPDKILPF